MFTPADHEDLLLAHDLMGWASELVNTVMERHRMDVNAQTISFMTGAREDLAHAEREVEMAERYMGWSRGGAA